MATRDATLYTNQETNKYLADARDRDGRTVFRRLAHTVVSGGEAIADIVQLAVIPANCEVLGVYLTTDGLGTSVTVSIGDSGDADRYAVATAMAAANDAIQKLAFTGANYRPTADTIVTMTYAGAAATAAKKVEGWITYCPAI